MHNVTGNTVSHQTHVEGRQHAYDTENVDENNNREDLRSQQMPKVDIIEMYCTCPMMLRNSTRAMIDKLHEVYGESLQSCITEIFYATIEHGQNAPVIQYIFFALLNDEDFVQDMVRTNMPEHLLERLDLFLQYIDVKYNQLIRVHPTRENAEILMEQFAEVCSMAWMCNLCSVMRRTVEQNIADNE